jgi:hypothetical protein
MDQEKGDMVKHLHLQKRPRKNVNFNFNQLKGSLKKQVLL